MINKNTFHICHHCLEASSNYRGDINRHLKKKNKCNQYSNLFNFEKSIKYSLYKKYTFNFDTSILSKDDILFIITNYNNQNNYIYENYRDEDLIKKNNESIFNKIDTIINNLKEYEKNFICPHCKYTFTTKHNLLKHTKNKLACDDNKEKYELLKEFKKQEELKGKS